MCTGMIARVLGEMAALTAPGSRVRVSSISQSTGMAPTDNTASKLATKVKVGTITSSPAPIPALARATVRAAVPLLTRWACRACMRAARAASISRAFQWPWRMGSNPYRINTPVSSTSCTDFFSASPNRSNPGMASNYFFSMVNTEPSRGRRTFLKSENMSSSARKPTGSTRTASSPCPANPKTASYPPGTKPSIGHESMRS